MQDWIDHDVAVLTQESNEVMEGKLVSTDALGFVLSMTTTRAQELGVFKGLSEEHEIQVFVPWFRCRLMATSEFTGIS